MYVGLFGYSDSGAIIRNVGLTDADLTATTYVGAILGLASNQGIFDNLWSSGEITSNGGKAEA